MTALTVDEIVEQLGNVSGWHYNASKNILFKEYAFKDFMEAMSFANKIGAAAEEMNHHPEIIVSWGKLAVALSTHEVRGITMADFGLAAKIDELKGTMI